MTLKFQPSAPAVSNQRLRSRNGSSPTASCLADRSGRSTSRAIAERPSPRRSNHQGWNDSRNDQVRDCLEGTLMTLQRLTRISLLAALCVASTSGFCPFPKCPTYFCHLFLVIFEGYSFAFLVMMITMFVSAFFLGMSLIVFFQIVAFGCPMLIWASVTSGCPCPSDPFVGLLSLLMGS